MTELIVESGTDQTIDSGVKRLKRLEIRKNATLYFMDTTTLVVDKFVAHDGARIVYKAMDQEDNSSFTLFCLDASEVQNVSFIGNGKAGTGYPKGSSAGKGSSGRNAKGPSFKYPGGKKASSGSKGSSGGHAHRGEDAVDFVLYFPDIPPGAEVKVEGIGGKGGNGQNGGRGGDGGNRSISHDGRNGGAGGNAGNGGDGGDASQAYIFVIVPDDVFNDHVQKDKIVEKISFSIDIAPGDGGSGGSGGSGGQPGRGAYIAPGRKRAGPDGRDGTDGDIGDGPTANGGFGDWVQIDIMSKVAYNQYVAQQLTTPDQH